MSEDLINEQIQPHPGPVYPRGRYIALLAVLFVLIAIISIAQILPNPDMDSSFSDKVLEGDLSIKLAYAYERWAPLMQGGQAEQIEAISRTQRQAAIQWYQRAVRENATPANLRRLLIIQESRQREPVLERLSRAKDRKSSEIEMWRAVYLSDAPLTSAQVESYRQTIRRLGLGWYEHLALEDLYTRAGMMAEARGEHLAASRSATRTVIWFLALLVVLFSLGVVGIGLLIWYAMAKGSGTLPARDADPGATEAARSFVAGHLLEVFVVYLAITIGVQLAVAPVLLAIPEAARMMVMIYLTVGVYTFSGVLAFAYLYYRVKKSGWSWQTLGLTSHNVWADIRWGIGGYAAALPLIVVAGVISRVIGRYVETPSNPIIPMFLESSDALQRIALFLLAAVAAPVFEEMFFRGALYHSFRARYGVRTGIVFSAVVFALVHPLPLNFLPILALGLVFATLVHQRGSLLPSMIAHGMNNTVAFALLLISTSS